MPRIEEGSSRGHGPVQTPVQEVVVAQDQVAPESAELPSLIMSLRGRPLTDRQRLTALAINAFSFDPQVQRNLFAADLYYTKGHVKTLKLGFTHREVADGRDYVVTEPEGEANWARMQRLRGDPKAVVVANFKKHKVKHAQIASITKLSMRELERISGKLADLGLSRRNVLSRAFEEFCLTVAEADKDANGVVVSPSVLAERFHVKERRVDAARARNRARILFSTRGAQEIAEDTQRIRDAILSGPERSNVQITEALLKRGVSGVTVKMVEHNRHNLITDKLIQSKRPDLTAKAKPKQ